jgi:hypothetical protein
MRLVVAVFASFPVLWGPLPVAQTKPDFSGRWALVLPAEDVRREMPLLNIHAADELIVRQTPTSITVEHPSGLGTHPKAATHAFGSRGTVGRAGEQSGSDVFWFGDQLLIGVGSTSAPDAEGRRQSVESGEMWSFDDKGRLVIDCTERQSGMPTRRATLTYQKRLPSRRGDGHRCCDCSQHGVRIASIAVAT